MSLDPQAVAELIRAAGGLRPIAVGIATVELDRAAGDLAAADPGLTFAEAPDDELLGARCRVSTADQDLAGTRMRVVLLEPSTEGLLAATLARHGEGPAVVYAARADVGELRGTPRSNLGGGPLGPGRLRVGSRFGPHVILLDAPLHSPGHRRLAGRPRTIRA